MRAIWIDLADVDVLLSQWAVWGAGYLRRLQHTSSRWQRDYDSGYQEEGLHAELPPGDDEAMERVDRAMAYLRRTDIPSYVILIDVYVNHRPCKPGRREAAVRCLVNILNNCVDRLRFAG